MNDQYDFYCFERLRERSASKPSIPLEADDVTCACADYLAAEGYEASINRQAGTGLGSAANSNHQ